MGRTKNVKRKKKSAFGIFIHKFIRSAFWIFVLIAIGVVSYKATMLYYDKTGGPKDERAAFRLW